MAAYIARRLVWVVFLLFMITLITFVIFSVLPSGDPAVLRAGRQPSPELVASIRKSLGLDKSAPVQFWNYLKDVIPFLAVGIPVGMISAVKTGSFADRLTMGTALIFISAPVYFLGLVMLYLFADDIGRF